METAVGGQKAERHPSLVHIRRGSMLKTADIVGPEAEAAHKQA